MALAEGETHRSVKQNRPKIDPHICNQIIFDSGANVIQWEKNSVFNKW